MQQNQWPQDRQKQCNRGGDGGKKIAVQVALATAKCQGAKMTHILNYLQNDIPPVQNIIVIRSTEVDQDRSFMKPMATLVLLTLYNYIIC